MFVYVTRFNKMFQTICLQFGDDSDCANGALCSVAILPQAQAIPLLQFLHDVFIQSIQMAPKQRTTFPAEVKDHDGSMVEKQWDAAERSIANPAAFKSWGTADIGVKKKTFRAQTKELEPAAQKELQIEQFFDPDEIRKLYSGLHIEVKKSTEPVQTKMGRGYRQRGGRGKQAEAADTDSFIDAPDYVGPNGDVDVGVARGAKEKNGYEVMDNLGRTRPAAGGIRGARLFTQEQIQNYAR